MSARHWVEMYARSLPRGGKVQRRWRWRFVTSNGRILADSGQSYRLDCLRGAQRVCGYDVEIREVES